MSTADQPMGAVSYERDQWVVRFERQLAHPPEKVWRALTESEHLEAWMPCDIVGERRAGASVDLPFWPAHVEKWGIETPTLTGEILVWEPPTAFEWMWSTDRLRWDLQATGTGTLLTFTTWLSDEGAGAVKTAAGYHVCLDNLVELLDTGTAPPLVDVDPARWEQRYGEVVGER